MNLIIISAYGDSVEEAFKNSRLDGVLFRNVTTSFKRSKVDHKDPTELQEYCVDKADDLALKPGMFVYITITNPVLDVRRKPYKTSKIPKKVVVPEVRYAPYI